MADVEAVTVTASTSAMYGTYATFRVTAAKTSESGSGSALFNAGFGYVPAPAFAP